MLGKVDASAEAVPSDVSNLAVTASGSVSDGLGGGWTATFNSVPGRAPSSPDQQMRRGVLATAPTGAALGQPYPRATATMSPGLYLGVFNSDPTRGSAHGYQHLYEYAYPLLLSSPNIFKRPDTLGDGGNQFVYDSQYPTGFLLVPGFIVIRGGDQNDAQWLLDNNKVDLKVENHPIPHALTHDWRVSGDSIQVHVPDEYGQTFPWSEFAFKGLPASNDDFGNHEVNLYVEGSKSETAHIQTFYTGSASNFPGSDGITANWYHYYYPIFDASLNPIDYQHSASSSDVSLTEGNSPYAVHIKDSAYSVTYNTNYLRVFDIDPKAMEQTALLPIKPTCLQALYSHQRFVICGERTFTFSNAVRSIADPNFPHYVRWIGELTLPGGIMQYVHEATHERGHQYLDQLCGTSSRNGPIYTDSVDPLDYNSSEDGDIVVDNWEASHHLNAGSSDTAHAYVGSGANDENDGDGELLADVQTLSAIFNQFEDWRQDWADGGIQKGPVAFLQPDPVTHIVPGFPLTFTPISNVDPVTGSPTFGTSYQVKTLSDLPANVLTSLSQLGP